MRSKLFWAVNASFTAIVFGFIAFVAMLFRALDYLFTSTDVAEVMLAGSYALMAGYFAGLLVIVVLNWILGVWKRGPVLTEFAMLLHAPLSAGIAAYGAANFGPVGALLGAPFIGIALVAASMKLTGREGVACLTVFSVLTLQVLIFGYWA